MRSPKYREPQKGNAKRKRGYNNGKRSSVNNNNSKKSKQSTGQVTFQLHGKKIHQTVTYTKVLDHFIVKIQNTFDRPINIVKTLVKIKIIRLTNRREPESKLKGLMHRKSKLYLISKQMT